MDWDTRGGAQSAGPADLRDSKLDWSELDQPEHAELFELNRRLLAIRHSYPDFTDPRFDHSVARTDEDEGWLLIERGAMLLLVNFAAEESIVSVPDGLELVLTIGDVSGPAEDGVALGPHSALVGHRPDPYVP